MKLWLAIAALALVSACGPDDTDRLRADPSNGKQVARGAAVYAQHCAACHGARLEGQPNWKSRLESGRMPAPPHDDTGHTWHHTDDVLFTVTKHGLAPPLVDASYQSDMPAFEGKLTDDEIWAVLAYIKSRWSHRVARKQEQMTRRDKR